MRSAWDRPKSRRMGSVGQSGPNLPIAYQIINNSHALPDLATFGM